MAIEVMVYLENAMFQLKTIFVDSFRLSFQMIFNGDTRLPVEAFYLSAS